MSTRCSKTVARGWITGLGQPAAPCCRAPLRSAYRSPSRATAPRRVLEKLLMTWKVRNVFARSGRCTLYWARWLQTASYHHLFFKTVLIENLQFKTRSSGQPFRSRLSTQNCVCISHHPHAYLTPFPASPPPRTTNIIEFSAGSYDSPSQVHIFPLKTLP